MRTLKDLLNLSEGLRFLESKGIYVAHNECIDQLRGPVQSNLADFFGVGKSTKLVYAGQQIYVDYRQSVLSKMLVLQDLENEESIFPFLVWADTDRSGSDKLTTRIVWPNHDHTVSISIAPPGTKDLEPRFIDLDALQLQKAIDRLGTCLFQSTHKQETKSKYRQLRALFLQERAVTLSAFNRQLAHFLLSNHLGFNPHSIFVSDIVNQGMITDTVNLCLNAITSFIRVFNESVYSLIQKEVDPQVKPLAEDYLPLRYSCEIDNKRMKLYHKMDGIDHYAVGTCKCGVDYSFYLGSRSLSIDELATSNRWSPDVSLPIFLNDLVSGVVAGKSSALYGIVLNEVLSKVLGKKPVPVLVPTSLGEKENSPRQFDSLIYSYLTE